MSGSPDSPTVSFDPARDLDDVPTWVLCQALRQRSARHLSTITAFGGTVWTFEIDGPEREAEVLAEAIEEGDRPCYLPRRPRPVEFYAAWLDEDLEAARSHRDHLETIRDLAAELIADLGETRWQLAAQTLPDRSPDPCLPS